MIGDKKVLFSGMQATGNLTLGNYLGALKNWVTLSDDYESLVIFSDGSWINEFAFYNASTSKIKNYTKNTYSSEEILAINTEVRLKLEMSSLAIRRNYFRYLEDALNNSTTSSE